MEETKPIVAVVTALALERDAVLRMLTDVVEMNIDGRTVHRGRCGNVEVAVECFHAMGNVTSAIRTTRAIERWKPAAVALVGIAGGTKKPTTELFTKDAHFLGDVLIAEQIIDYESGKQTEAGLEHRPQVHRSSGIWIESAKNLKLENWIPRITATRPDGTTGRVVPQFHFGVIASGSKVLKDQSPLKPVSDLFSNLVGVEMEGLGAAAAAADGMHPVHFLLLKGICDWADPAKNDKWQPYAAEASAACLAAIIESIYPKVPTVNAPPAQDVLPVKLIFIQRLLGSWEDLADALQIPLHEKAKFEKGNEPRRIWEWFESRGQLDKLTPALRAIGREDLLEDSRQFP